MSHVAFKDWVSEYKGKTANPPGSSTLEKLPNEILSQILEYLKDTTSRVSSSLEVELHQLKHNTPTKGSLFSCLQTSRRLYEITVPIIWRSPSLSFLSKTPCSIQLHGHHIRSLDLRNIDSKPKLLANTHLSHLMEVDNVEGTSLTVSGIISNMMSFTPGLTKVILPATALSDPGLAKSLLFGHHSITTLGIEDMNGDSADISIPHYMSVWEIGLSSPLTALSLKSLKSTDFLGALLSRCARLRSLQVNDSQFDVQSLSCLSPDARLRNLDLRGSTEINPSIFASQVLHHPALRSLESLVLPLEDDSVPQSFQDPSFRTQQISVIINNLPPSLRILNLGSCDMSCHIASLQKLSSQLEEMSLGSFLDIYDAEEVVLGHAYDLSQTKGFVPSRKSRLGGEAMKMAVSMCYLQKRIRAMSAKIERCQGSSVRYLNLRDSRMEVSDLMSSVLLGRESLPLRTIELPKSMHAEYQGLARFCPAVGWKLQWSGDRIWMVRKE